MERTRQSTNSTTLHKRFWINVPLSDDANPLGFLDLISDDAFYAYITTQTNIYTDQYLAADPKLPPHSR